MDVKTHDRLQQLYKHYLAHLTWTMSGQKMCLHTHSNNQWTIHHFNFNIILGHQKCTVKTGFTGSINLCINSKALIPTLCSHQIRTMYISVCSQEVLCQICYRLSHLHLNVHTINLTRITCNEQSTYENDSLKPFTDMSNWLVLWYQNAAKTQTPDCILSQFNPVNITTTYFPMINFNKILPSPNTVWATCTYTWFNLQHFKECVFYVCTCGFFSILFLFWYP